MMINLDPIPPMPQMSAHAAQFLDLLADPAAARKLMEDIKLAHDRATAAFEEAKKLQQEVGKKQTKHNEDVATFEQNRKAHTAFLNSTANELDNRATELDRREAQLAVDRDALVQNATQHQAAVSAHQAEVAAHNTRVQDRLNAETVLASAKEKVDRWRSWIDQRPE